MLNNLREGVSTSVIYIIIYLLLNRTRSTTDMHTGYKDIKKKCLKINTDIQN